MAHPAQATSGRSNRLSQSLERLRVLRYYKTMGLRIYSIGDEDEGPPDEVVICLNDSETGLPKSCPTWNTGLRDTILMELPMGFDKGLDFATRLDEDILRYTEGRQCHVSA